MNPQFSQPGGSVSKETNKESIARKFGCKKSDVLYAKAGQTPTGYKVIYDKVSQRSYALPSNLAAGVTITSLVDGVLVHSGGTVDLGALAVLRGEFVTLVEDFTSGFTIKVKNEVVSDGTNLYRWAGTLPKTVNAGATIANTGGVSATAWEYAGVLSVLRTKFGAGYVGTQLAATGSVLRTQAAKNADSISVLDFGAKGDGVANDTPAFLAAFASVPNGGTLHVPAGVYLVNQILNLEGKKMNLVGDGLNQTIIRASAVMTHLFSLAEASTTYSFNECRVSGIQFDGADKAGIVFNVRHRHYCHFQDCAFFNATQFNHQAQDSWCNTYTNCVFGNGPVLLYLAGSNHRNAFRSCSLIGGTNTFMQCVDGADGNSAIVFDNCDFEFQNGTLDVTGVYLRTSDIISFNDCYLGENINGTHIYLEGTGTLRFRGGILFNGISANSKMVRVDGSGEVIIEDMVINGGSFASLASLISQFGGKASFKNVRMNFAHLGTQTLPGEGLGKHPYPNPVITKGKGYTLGLNGGTATVTFDGSSQKVAVTAPPASGGVMALSSAIDQSKVSVIPGSSGRFCKIIVTYASSRGATLRTTETVLSSPVDTIATLAASANKVCAVTSGTISSNAKFLEIDLDGTGTDAWFQLYDVTILDADFCTLSTGQLTQLFKAL